MGEVFAVGDWKGDKYGTKDLDEIVKGFDETKDALKPYVKLGHNDGQNLAQKDGLPAVGWIENVRRQGKKLLVDIKNVPKKIYELIKTGAYKRVSSEIFFNLDINGKKYPKLLKAVAFLGGDTPAVTSLDDILALYTQELNFTTEVKNFREYSFSPEEAQKMDQLMQMMQKMMDELKLQGEGDTPEAKVMSFVQKLAQGYKQAQDANAAQSNDVIVAQDKAKQAQLAQDAIKQTNCSLEEEIKTLKAENFSLKEEKTKIEVNTLLDKLTLEKKIIPAQRDFAYTLLMDLKQNPNIKKFKFGDKEMGIEETFLTFVGQNNFSINTALNTTTGDPQVNKIKAEEQGYDADSVAIAEKVKKYSEEHKVSVKEAYNVITSKK